MTEHQDHDQGSPWSADSANAATQAVAADAVRLLGSLQDWARRSFPAPTAGSSGAAECQWCPLCQFASVLRGEHPELSERVTEASTALLAAARGVLDAAAGAAGAGHGTGSPSGGAPGPDGGDTSRRPGPGPGERVQRIDLGDGP